MSREERSCVVYARVSTKEQETEGYSIPAQLAACRELAAAERLTVAAEFVESETARRAGRPEFMRMCSYLADHAETRHVVAHKLDRLYRNFRDQLTLEEDLGARVRLVIGDVPDSPQGELLRDVNLAVAKHYSANLSQEVKKGMREKAAQGGWPHRAPLGYRNDKTARAVVQDSATSAAVTYAFSRYATGLVSLAELGEELRARGVTGRNGRRLAPSALQKLLRNPFYVGLVRYGDETFRGNHEPLTDTRTFEAVAEVLAGKRNGVKRIRHTFALKGPLRCAECGCVMTAERHGAHVYYRCTHGKGREVCGHRRYWKESELSDELSAVLGRIAVSPGVVEALAEEARRRDEERGTERSADWHRTTAALDAARARLSAAIDAMLDGVLDRAAFESKQAEIKGRIATFERRLAELGAAPSTTFEQVEHLASLGSGACIAFEQGSTEEKRETLATVLLNATVGEDGIASYQYKDPFGVLEMDSSGAFLHPWWAMRDLNPRLPPCKGGTLPLS